MKNVIITGAAGALGKATVEYFLDKGYSVFATIHKETDNAKLPSHKLLSTQVLDLNNTTDVNSYIKEVTGKIQIDAALLLAGGYAGGKLSKTSIEDINRQIAMNFDTAYNVARPLWSYFLEKNAGRLVFIGSQLPLQLEKSIQAVAYTLSKSLLFTLAEIMNKESKGLNVVASIVAPSTIDTASNRQYMPQADYNKWVKTEELAELFEFLISDKASSIREPVIKAFKNVI
jgi:NAD(P)-dependent dehydrogenase (short-subunit alcohol dehydrogenase family)